MQCLDDLDVDGKPFDLNLYGYNENKERKELEIFYMPCTPRQWTELNKHLADELCLADLKSKSSLQQRLKKSKQYIAPGSLVIINNS